MRASFTDLLLRRMRSVAMAMTSPRISSTVALGSLATSSVDSRFQFLSSTQPGETQRTQNVDAEKAKQHIQRIGYCFTVLSCFIVGKVAHDNFLAPLLAYSQWNLYVQQRWVDIRFADIDIDISDPKYRRYRFGLYSCISLQSTMQSMTSTLFLNFRFGLVEMVRGVTTYHIAK